MRNVVGLANSQTSGSDGTFGHIIRPDSGPLLYLRRIDSAVRTYTLMGGTKAEVETTWPIVRYLSPIFLIEKRSTLIGSGIRHDGIEASIHEA